MGNASNHRPQRPQRPLSRFFGYLTCFVTGLAILVLELIAFRLLAPYFGTSSYVVGAIINTILLALAIGYLIGGYTVDRFKSPTAPYLVVALSAIYLTAIYAYYPDLLRLMAERSVIAGSFLAILVLFFVPMVLLAFVPPYLIKLLLVESKVGVASGLIFSISTVGSIVGGLLTTFYFIPYLGSRLTLLITLVVLYLLAVVGLTLANRTYALLMPLPLLPFLLSPQIPDDRHVDRVESEYNVITVAEAYGRNLLLLNDNIGIQSVSLDPESQLAEHFYTDYFLLPHLIRDVDRTLILGNAAGTTMTSLAHYFPGSIDGVEIDPAITRVGERYFGLDPANKKITIIHQDGRLFLNNNDNSYDVIIIDMYGGGPYIPFHVGTIEFFQRVANSLTDRGVMAINLPFFAEDTQLEHHYLSTLSRVFDRAFRFRQVLYAFKQPTTRADVAAGANRQPLPDPLQQLADKLLDELIAIDLPTTSSDIFTDDYAPLEKLTSDAISNTWLANERALRRQRLGY